MPISGTPAQGRAFAALPAGCGLIAAFAGNTTGQKLAAIFESDPRQTVGRSHHRTRRRARRQKNEQIFLLGRVAAGIAPHPRQQHRLKDRKIGVAEPIQHRANRIEPRHRIHDADGTDFGSKTRRNCHSRRFDPPIEFRDSARVGAALVGGTPVIVGETPIRASELFARLGYCPRPARQ